jgi:RNA polymerase sigma-70 factor (ECF subfamily)
MIGSTFPVALAAARAGDEAAFAAIWRELHPALLRYLRVLVGDASEDIASETWAAVATSIDRFSGTEQAFRAWLFTVARRRAIDFFRREARRPSIPVAPDSFRAISSTDSPENPSDVAIATIATESALALIATLSADQAEVVMLRVIAGLDVAQVAAIMQKRPGTVRVLAHRALRELARRISEQEPRAVTP